MIFKLLLAIALLVGVFWYINHIKSLPPKKKKQTIYRSIIIALITILTLGTLTGRMHWLGAAFAALIPILRIGFSTITRLWPLWLNKTGGVASFTTDHLVAKINIQQRTLTGTITKGMFEGQEIADLSQQQLEQLANYYKEKDLKSYYLIRFQQKKAGDQSQTHSQTPSFGNPSREEALLILGLEETPTPEEITSAHRKLINKVHPDKGGNDFLASRINQARDILLQK